MSTGAGAGRGTQRLARHIRRAVAVAITGVVVATAALVSVALGIGSPPGAAAGIPKVLITQSACGPGWKAPASGRRSFAVDNTTSLVYQVDLVGADQVTTYGEIEILAPGTTRPIDVVLPPGQYSFECEAVDGSTTFSSPETVTGPPVAGAHPYLPAAYDQLQLATLDYRNAIEGWMRRLVGATAKLTSAVDAGDLAPARRLWLPAHLDYARLGAAYDTFGNFNAEIDGRPNGLPGGVNDPRFEGFLRLEYGLWHRQPASELKPVADRLYADVRGLLRAFPQLQTPINDVSLRTHEILENTLQFELTGETDQGSHTNLATALANTEGTEIALAAIAPLIRQRSPSLVPTLRSGLEALAKLLSSFRRPDGTWVAVEALTTSQREHVDGAVSGLLERLEVVPDLLELPIQPITVSN